MLYQNDLNRFVFELKARIYCNYDTDMVMF